jgi:hypothetical protein
VKHERHASKGLYADARRRAVLVNWRFDSTRAGTDVRVAFHSDDRLLFGEDGLISEHRCLHDNAFVKAQLKGVDAL